MTGILKPGFKQSCRQCAAQFKLFWPLSDSNKFKEHNVFDALSCTITNTFEAILKSSAISYLLFQYQYATGLWHIQVQCPRRIKKVCRHSYKCFNSSAGPYVIPPLDPTPKTQTLVVKICSLRLRLSHWTIIVLLGFYWLYQ